MTISPPPSNFSLFSLLKIKLKGRRFDTIEVIEAELQAVLNTLIEHDFRHAFKSGMSAGNGVFTQKSVMVASRTEVSFDLMAATVPEIMDGSLYI
jgi:hypothetical protein